ncbi:unnamed protein product [Phytomonas sp. Hart1]|nr:unnamed protein product [Phytomonas sp. Hart1]|eukprot:CCW68970.1 unnamed protein product [Phytomonas sp. isolate Hart1]
MWSCSICSKSNSVDATYCAVCLYSRPMDRHGVPQIFAGYAIHFNGVIPRTILHPSHSIEWRMVERHGAVCIPKFDPVTVNLLLYRQGYERSEKCRLCVEYHTHIPAVPITWMMESLMQSRQIRPALYRLNSIPALAGSSMIGNVIPHHNHPYYHLNKGDYAIPTSFPRNNSLNSMTFPSSASRNGSFDSKLHLNPVGDVNMPSPFDVDPPLFTNVGVFDAVVGCTERASHAHTVIDTTKDNSIPGARKGKPEIHLIQCMQKHNVINPILFTGIRAVLSPSLEKCKTVLKALQACGATVMSPCANLEQALRSGITHIIYSHDDKKSDFMIASAYLKSSAFHNVQLIQSNWLEDCLLVGESIPAYGMYVPTVKLMETLNKKGAKRDIKRYLVSTK